METGGIIIGYYSSNLSAAIVNDVTGAPDDSKSNQKRFFRGTNGLNRLLENLWKEGKYYLGEWHYHPDASPIPSKIDNQQMINISTNNKFACPEPILIIVGGRVGSFNYSINVYKKGQRIELLNKQGISNVEIQ